MSAELFKSDLGDSGSDKIIFVDNTYLIDHNFLNKLGTILYGPNTKIIDGYFMDGSNVIFGVLKVGKGTRLFCSLVNCNGGISIGLSFNNRGILIGGNTVHNYDGHKFVINIHLDVMIICYDENNVLCSESIEIYLDNNDEINDFETLIPTKIVENKEGDFKIDVIIQRNSIYYDRKLLDLY